MLRILLTCLCAIWAFGAIAQSGYQVRPGDTLAIEVLEDETLNRRVLVLPEGSISFPLVGTIKAGGKTVDMLKAELTAKLAPNFASQPSVFVSVVSVLPDLPLAPGQAKEKPKVDIYIMGEVAKPGEIQVKPKTTLLQALALTGGFTKFAATKRIQLRRVDPATGTYVAYRFNYRAVEGGATISGHTHLAEGDVIVVPQRRLFE